MSKLSIYIFRRDIRLEDNTALIKALEESKEVIPIFILNDNQITEKNEYKSDNSLQFMFQSLRELDEKLKEKGSKLYLFRGNQIEILKELISKYKIKKIYQNRDYTPFARGRDKKLADLEVPLVLCDDYMLNKPESVFNKSGEPFKVFTPYYKASQLREVAKVKKNTHKNYFNREIKEAISLQIFDEILPEKNKDIFREGGRKEALEILSKITKFENYREERNFPSENGTTGLSAHLKFGTISVREMYWTLRKKFDENHELIRQLYWRDFWQQIIWHFPYVIGGSFNKQYDKLQWAKNKKNLQKWKEGKTGFPIVDAGMRQLNKTGYMHNRVRMIVASFLTKDLHIDWREGEKYFAQKLVDYDPALNNGNWQWAASTGTDAQPYFRIFNPWLQQKKFDGNCEYIKKWVLELSKLTAKQINDIGEYGSPIENYPDPIVEHLEVSAQAKEMFKSVN